MFGLSFYLRIFNLSHWELLKVFTLLFYIKIGFFLASLNWSGQQSTLFFLRRLGLLYLDPFFLLFLRFFGLGSIVFVFKELFLHVARLFLFKVGFMQVFFVFLKNRHFISFIILPLRLFSRLIFLAAISVAWFSKTFRYLAIPLFLRGESITGILLLLLIWTHLLQRKRNFTPPFKLSWRGTIPDLILELLFLFTNYLLKVWSVRVDKRYHVVISKPNGINKDEIFFVSIVVICIEHRNKHV